MMSKKQETTDDAPEVGHTLSKGVPVGYKRTEVGVIPEDWELGKFEDFGVFRSGSGFPLVFQGRQSGDYPFFKVSDMNNEGNELFMKNANHWISEDERRKLGATNFRPGSIVFAKIGAAIFLERKRLLSQESCLDNNMMAFSLVNSHACQRFFHYLFLRTELGKLVSTTALPALSKRQIGVVNVPIPPPAEQRAIAEALSDVDGLLAALDGLIAKKRAIKQAAMQQLLTGKTRLPGFGGKWTELNMARDSTLKARIGWQGLTTAEYLTSGNYYLVTGTDFVHGRVGWASCFFVDRSRFIQDTNIQLAPYDVLLTKDGTIGKAGFIDSLPGPATLNSGIFVIRPKADAYIPKYMYYVLTSQIFDDFLARLQAGSTISHLYQKDFVDFTFKAPKINEQRAIAAVLSDMDAEISALERRRNKTRAIKQGMMQQLLTGWIRLVQPETTTEELAVARPVGRKHNWQFNEAVVISVLAKHFGTQQYPLSRMRYTKLSYLLHRHEEGHAEGYLKKAAGPYNPQTRYGGPEKIALQKDYVSQYRSSKGQGFIASTNFDEAESYFDKWYRSEVLQWLEQFRYKTNNDLELLTTVDMAAEELCEAGEEVSVENVKEVIRSHPEWDPKLDRPIFSDANLARAIESCQKLFRRKQ